jgi:hypothetical protein
MALTNNIPQCPGCLIHHREESEDGDWCKHCVKIARDFLRRPTLHRSIIRTIEERGMRLVK